MNEEKVRMRIIIGMLHGHIKKGNASKKLCRFQSFSTQLFSAPIRKESSLSRKFVTLNETRFFMAIQNI